jgi:molecular chaperone GrpE
MGKSNGKSETKALDLEHELPAADADETSPNVNQAAAPAPEASGLEAELRQVKAERDMYVDRLARMQAEFDNARKRALKEQQDFRDFASVDAIKPLLPVIDNFERALQAKSEPADFRSGVELIYKQLQDVMAKLGVRPIAAKGEPFDPHVH